MTSEFKGYLDRLRENLDVLDEQIEHAREMSKTKDASALQWTKTFRDLVELRNVTLEKIKGHLLGRAESGVVNEPDDCWDDNSQVMYERLFNSHMSPWTMEDLKLTCKDCGAKSEQVQCHLFSRSGGCDRINLCHDCFEKRKTPDSE